LSENRIGGDIPVVLLDAEQDLISKPNKIASKDFEGWGAEFASNIPSGWADDYKPLVELRLSGGATNRGALLVAKNGSGTFVFVSLALRRQLLAGIPGAYLQLANLTGQQARK